MNRENRIQTFLKKKKMSCGIIKIENKHFPLRYLKEKEGT